MMHLSALKKTYRLLNLHYGLQHWWPAETAFEVVVGAILTQNTSWQNVTRALDNLKRERLLDPHRLFRVPIQRLAELIRPSGYYRIKAQRLRNVLEYLITRSNGSLNQLTHIPLTQLRSELLDINGVGPETADCILLYAVEQPSFVVDTYTFRICARHGWYTPPFNYERLKNYFESNFPEDVKFYQEFHALLVRVGHDYCGTTPQCTGCPLRTLLPDSGPQSLER